MGRLDGCDVVSRSGLDQRDVHDAVRGSAQRHHHIDEYLGAREHDAILLARECLEYGRHERVLGGAELYDTMHGEQLQQLSKS